MTLPDWLTTRLPTDGQMGVLHRNRPALYWLTLVVGATAFAGVLLALFYALALFPLVAGQAVVAVLGGDPVRAALWVGLLGVLGVGFVGIVVAAGRWVGQFVGGGERE